MASRSSRRPSIVNVAAHRLRNQRLVGARFDTPADTVRWLGAVQSQDYPGAKWALALRTRDVDDTVLDRAFDAGAFLRTHVMRPTWHFVAPEDLRWLLALTGPRVHAANAGVYRMCELDAKLLRRAHARFTKALQGGRSLTRQELAAVLEAGGIEASGVRLAYIVMHAELDGLLCSGPMRGKQHTYMLLEERVPPAPVLARDEALARLAQRYFTSHGPATAHDFAWWSGLTVADAREGAALAGSVLEQVVLDGKTYWTAASPASGDGEESTVHLLPNYDEHVVAYRNHGHTLDPAAAGARRARTDEPLGVHLVARDGLVVGGWRRTIEKGSVVVSATLLTTLRRAERAALRRAAEDYGRFLGRPVTLKCQ
jgi:hypothetical protein